MTRRRWTSTNRFISMLNKRWLAFSLASARFRQKTSLGHQVPFVHMLQVVDGVHFVKISRSQPHEMLTHIRNDTQFDVVVKQTNACVADLVPSMTSLPYSLDDTSGPHTLELRSATLRGIGGGSGSTAWHANISLESPASNIAVQPVSQTRHSVDRVARGRLRFRRRQSSQQRISPKPQLSESEDGKTSMPLVRCNTLSSWP